VVEFVRSRGVEWVCLDSDGRVTSLIPVWMDAGIDLLYPFEVAAGMDVLAVRRQFGRELRLHGGVDKRALAAGPAAIDRELARLAPLVQNGGYIPGVDHSLPPDISYSNYCYYMERLPTIL
jgi:uroporphyrinogen decarboxylase